MDGILFVLIGIVFFKNGLMYSDKVDIVKMKLFIFGIVIFFVIGGVVLINILLL